ncbi:hypothetical protein KC19_VG205900 [Ceratodon purpureus]|uniref:Uncharacterized protein n=1 Tax=Ceratodon purpureus TaxID=3225 RepID=A0A8T0HSM8_CERPU|nr:hypothetical protein KC19_VG205900 [Ceratodon purpureus]
MFGILCHLTLLFKTLLFTRRPFEAHMSFEFFLVSQFTFVKSPDLTAVITLNDCGLVDDLVNPG